jgi:RNA polymerase subunit RPABC4/transcription elongation factor Spt4
MAAGSIPCLTCGQPVPADATSCPSCGAPVAAGTWTGSSPATDAGEHVAPRQAPPSIDDPVPTAMAAVAEAAAAEAAVAPSQLPAAAPSAQAAAPSAPVAAPVAPDPAPVAAPAATSFAAGVGAIAGAYLPPSSVHRPDPGVAPAPRMPLASGPVTAAPDANTPPFGAGGYPAGTGNGDAPYPVAGYATVGYGAAARPDPDLRPPEPTPAAPSPRPGRVSLFADLPFDAPDSISEWLVTIGSSVAALSFLLPWAPRVVSYTSSWGLASPSHLPVLALLLVTAVLAILPNRVAVWIRSGVLGLIGGSLFLGVLWPYVVGDFGAEFGSIVGAAAAIILACGGIVAVAPRRQEDGEG